MSKPKESVCVKSPEFKLDGCYFVTRLGPDYMFVKDYIKTRKRGFNTPMHTVFKTRGNKETLVKADKITRISPMLKEDSDIMGSIIGKPFVYEPFSNNERHEKYRYPTQDTSKCYKMELYLNSSDKITDKYVGKFIKKMRQGSGDGMTSHYDFNKGGKLLKVDIGGPRYPYEEADEYISVDRIGHIIEVPCETNGGARSKTFKKRKYSRRKSY